MPRAKGPNQKAEAGRAQKAEHAAQKQAAIDQQRQAQEAAEWQKGANTKRLSREQEAAAKADEAARKRREKADLLAAEEAELGSGGTTQAKKAELSAKKSKNKGNKGKKKDDLALLEDALVSAADKKARKKKADDLAKQREQEQTKAKQQAKQQALEEQAKTLDPLLANTEKMIGDSTTDSEGAVVGRSANKARMEEAAGSGIEAALDTLNVTTGGGGGGISSPKLSAKALYQAFEERMLPQVKEDYPGLRLSQYKDKVWALYKKSPENPANQPPDAAASGKSMGR